MKEIDDILQQARELRRITDETVGNVEKLVKAVNLAMYYVDGDSSHEICIARVKEVLTERVNKNEQS